MCDCPPSPFWDITVGENKQQGLPLKIQYGLGIALVGEQELSFDLTVPYEHSLCAALAVRALPGACQSLPATCCESNAEMSHYLAMPREATQPSAGQSFLSAQKRYSHVRSTLPLN